MAARDWQRRFSKVRMAAWLVLGSLFLASGNPLAAMAAEDKKAEQEKPMRFFELRTYITEPGRLDALHKRFRDHTNRLFVKHGMTLVGYWTPADGPEAENTLIYILAFPSREARETAFKAFREDPQWHRVRDESEKDGKIVKQVISKFMTPTDYSPIK